MRKVLILGAGGTGSRVISRLKELIEWRDSEGNTIEDFPNIKYYEIDTDPDSGAVCGNNFTHLNVSHDKANSFVTQINNEGRHQWADSRLIKAIHNGAEATRMIGKFCFLCHYDEIKRNIGQRLAELYTIPDEINQSKMIYIVCNSSSGTGSGCFVDYGYLVKSIIRSNNTYREDTSLKVTLILTLPEANCNRSNYNRNSYFALQDLNHYMAENKYEIEHPSTGIRLESPIEIKPFDYIYLVGPQRRGNQTFREIEHIIGDYIYNDISSISAPVRDGARVDMNGILEREDQLGYVQRYLTFGFATIEYPVMQIAKAATFKSIEESLTTWLEEEDRTYEFDYKDIHLGNDGKGSIRSELLKAVDIGTHSNTTTRKDINSILADLKNNFYRKFVDNENDVRQLELLITAINNCFPDGNNPDDPNFQLVSKIIVENTRLLSLEQRGWCYRIKNELLDTMFEKKKGISSVLTFLDEIDKRLVLIENTNIDNGGYSRKRKDINDVCENMKNTKSDLFNRFGAFDKASINISFSKFKSYIESYIKARLDYEAARAARELISTIGLREALTSFKNRIEVFKLNIEERQKELKAKYEEEITFVPLNGYIVQQNNIAILAREAIERERINWSSLISGNIKPLFKPRLLNNTRIQFTSDTKGNERSFIIYNNDLESIIKKERTTFRGRLTEINIIEEFLNEVELRDQNYDNEQGESTIRREFRKSNHFLNWEATDQYADTDREELTKKWFFYPGGDTIQNVGQATEENNRFANHLRLNGLVDNWANESKLSDNSISILMLQERGGIQIRYLSFINEDNVQRAIHEANALTEIKDYTFISRKDVVFLPILRIEGRVLNSIKILFVISIVANNLKLINNTWVSEKQNVYNPPPPIKLPLNYKNAVYKLCENKDDQAILKLSNETYINANRCDFMERLERFLRNQNGFGLVLSERETTELLTLLQIYIRRSNFYTDWNKVYPDYFGEYRTKLHYVSEDEICDMYPNAGSYCKICKRPVSQNLVVDIDAELDLLETHACTIR